ncbi:hypothetical protein JK358_37785 [Nocardia sp. 2]|uniref:Secreted protein n=1 Tax=Nocardia acididurans TaxID=2802282 RepID=A0ABS1MHR4_9NOCA|nr:hypothetical protein [Nocardia acididurans]MBL1080162.1 hypothetical protein [Nocardia acididurans]
MVTIRQYQRLTLTAAAVAAVGSALVVAAAPAFAANAIDVTGIGPTNVGVDYSCDASAGATAIKVMVGAPDAESPSATGAQHAIVCDGTNRTAVIMLEGAGGASSPLSAGQTVQVRVALVDGADNVVSGQNKVVSLG